MRCTEIDGVGQEFSGGDARVLCGRVQLAVDVQFGGGVAGRGVEGADGDGEYERLVLGEI